MKRTRRSLAVAFLLGIIAPFLVGESNEVRLVVRVFIMAPTHEFDSVFTDGKGGTMNLQVQGDATSVFPHATVSFPTELAANASDDAIGHEIQERIVFGSGGLVARKISVRELKSLEFVLGKDHPTAEASFQESQGEGWMSNYEVRAQLLSSERKEALVWLRFSADWSHEARPGLGVRVGGDVISVPVELPESDLFLIGERDITEGNIYWLAVCALPR